MNQERLMGILLAPHVSEKATDVADETNQHVFRVLPDASKPEIKRAVETLFKVRVTEVRVLNFKGKHKRHGAIKGRRPDWKKAYVRLAQGDDIDFTGIK
jgi:large subunit ribosomal protein L23